MPRRREGLGGLGRPGLGLLSWGVALLAAVAPGAAHGAGALAPASFRFLDSGWPVTNVVALAWDARGNPWVLESMPEPAPHRSRVVSLVPGGEGGVRWRRSSEVDALPGATGLEWSPAGLYVGAAPELLFLQDTNRDGRIDLVTPVVAGLGGAGEGATVRELEWGPDGRLYFLYDGPNAATPRGLPHKGRGEPPALKVNPGVLRFTPTTRQIEAFADGPSHGCGLLFDADGRLLVASSTRESLHEVLPMATHLPRDHFPRPIDGFATRIDPLAERALRGVGVGGLWLDVGGGGSTMETVFLSYTNGGKVVPVELRPSRGGTLLQASVPPGAVTVGAAASLPPPLRGTARPGPDGTLWGVTLRGGVVRIVPAAGEARPAGPLPGVNLSAAGLEGLVDALQSSNRWVRTMGRRLLIDRADPASLPLLAGLLHSNPWGRPPRLEALWALASIPVVNGEWSVAAVSEKDPVVRGWGVRFLGETLAPGPETLRVLGVRARDREMGGRLEAAIALRRIETAGSLNPAQASPAPLPEAELRAALEHLVGASSADEDPALRGMIWGAFEPFLLRDRTNALALLRSAGDGGMPLSGELLSRSIRRIFGTREATAVDEALLLLGDLASESPQLCARGLQGMLQGQKGSKAWSGHKGIKRLLARLQETGNGELSASAQQVDALCGNPRAQSAILARISNPEAPEADRLRAILFTRVLPSDAARGTLLAALNATNSPALALASFGSLQEIGRPEEGVAVVGIWKGMAPVVRAAAIEGLAARPDWIPALLSGLESGEVAKGELTGNAIQDLRASPNPLVQARVTQLLGRE